jgi:hypothetical protein
MHHIGTNQYTSVFVFFSRPMQCAHGDVMKFLQQQGNLFLVLGIGKDFLTVYCLWNKRRDLFLWDNWVKR